MKLPKEVEQFKKELEALAEEYYKLPLFYQAVSEYERGGYPSTSVPEAISYTYEPGLPLPDAVDRQLTRAKKAVRQEIRSLHNSCERLNRVINSIIIAADPVPDEIPCGNLNCSDTLPGDDTEQASSKECPKCRVHRHRHGQPWPNRTE